MTDHDAERARRAERRRTARRLHPDHGGDQDEFIAAMAAIGAGGREDARAGATRITVVRGRRNSLGAVAVRVRRATRAGRSRLPRRWPGARRYVRL